MFSVTDRGTLCLHPTRREWLALGALAPLGLGLPRLLAARASRKARAKSCLLIFMEGGPSHIDLWDMKPDAPAEVRGAYQPIKTKVPGLHVCDRLPLFAQQAHRLSFVRSMTHKITDHNAGTYYHLTGRYPTEGGKLIVANSATNFPSFGAAVAKLKPGDGRLPDFVHIPEYQSNNNHDIGGQSAGFFGAAYDPLISGDPSLPNYELPGLTPRDDLPDRRLLSRDALRARLDRPLAMLADAPAARHDAFARKALGMLGSAEVRRAFDLSRESNKVREWYGTDPGSNRAIEAREFGGLPHLGQCMLLARRLIESGVRLVTLFTGRRIDQAWDTHRKHFALLDRSLCPPFDRACSALLQDMADRGLLDETLVVIFGEFGRTPKLGQITSGAGAAYNGRDHWPHCYTVMLAGAGVPQGKIIGASDAHAAYPKSEAYGPEDLAATIYEIMGIPAETQIRDPLDRPHALALGKPIAGVMG